MLKHSTFIFLERTCTHNRIQRVMVKPVKELVSVLVLIFISAALILLIRTPDDRHCNISWHLKVNYIHFYHVDSNELIVIVTIRSVKLGVLIIHASNNQVSLHLKELFVKYYPIRILGSECCPLEVIFTLTVLKNLQMFTDAKTDHLVYWVKNGFNWIFLSFKLCYLKL